MKHLFIIPFIATFLLTLVSAAADDDRPVINTDESKVPSYTLPDPLTALDGTVIRDKEQWEKIRRQEIYDMFCEEMYGRFPEGEFDENFEVVSSDAWFASGKATHKTIKATFSRNGRSKEVTFHLYTPNYAEEVPVFMYFHGEAKEDDPDLHRLLDEGYGLCTGDNSQFFPDRQNDPSVYQESILSLWGYDKEEDLPNDCVRALGVWAWGQSRALDYLETDSDVDAGKVVVMGFSRGGKQAAWAAASDPRFAIAILNNSGCGGAAIFRRKFGENVHRINRSFPYWFCENFHKYDRNDEKLPVDQHELIALIAPRPVYVGSGEEDSWSDPKGEFLSAANAESVYNLYGYTGIGSLDLPTVNIPVGHRVAYHVRSGGHAVMPFDWENYIKFADKWFR